jgi:hypothetical protein
MENLTELQERQISDLKENMYSIYGFKDGALLSKEHNMIKWSSDGLDMELFNKVYDEYLVWLKENKTSEEIRIEKETKALKSMMKSCFTYGGLTKDNTYINKYVYSLGMKLFNKVYDEYSKYIKENYFIIKDVYTDYEGCSYNSLKKII